MPDLKEIKRIIKQEKFTKKRKRRLKKILADNNISNSNIILRKSEKYIFQNRLGIYQGRAFNLSRTRNQFVKIESHIAETASVVRDFDFSAIMLMALVIPKQENNIGWSLDQLSKIDPAIIEKISPFIDAVRIIKSIEELNIIVPQILEVIPKATRGGQSNFPTLVDAIKGLAEIWKDAGAPVGRGVTNEPNSGKPTGAFFDFLTVALYPLLPKKTRHRTLEDAMKKVRKRGAK